MPSLGGFPWAKALSRGLGILLAGLLPWGSLQGNASGAGGKRPFLWKIQSPKGVCYLLGSIHAAKPEIYPLHEKIEQAFEQSDYLVVEANVTDSAKLGPLMERAVYPPEDGLDRHLSPDVLQLVEARCERHGLPAAQVRLLKPWALAMTLSSLELARLGVTPENGIDQHFLNAAQGRKPILELESVEEQINLLDGFSDREQEAFLHHSLQDLDLLGQSLEPVMEAWRAGDAEKLNGLIQAPPEGHEMASIYKKLLDDRNRKMAARVEGYLAAGETYFIVVGAAHLVGNRGLLELLAKKYRVEQL